MKKIILNLQFIFKPSYWLMNEPYSIMHDRLLNELMDNHKFTKMDRFTAILGNVEIWVSNYPYNVGIRSLSSNSRPSRLTIKKMWEKLNSEITINDIEKL